MQIGIRTEHETDNGFTVIDAAQVNDRTVDDVIAQVKAIVGDMPVYLTFDIDCLDPHLPSTGTPVIGGLTTDRALKLLRAFSRSISSAWIWWEVAPAYDQSDITALAGATIALEMLYLQRLRKRLKPVSPPLKQKTRTAEIFYFQRDYFSSRISENPAQQQNNDAAL